LANIDFIFLIIFGFILLIVMLIHKKRVKVMKFLFPLFYLVMYRTKLGIPSMDKYARKHPRFFQIFSFIGIVLGFIGMAIVFYGLLISSLRILAKPLVAEAGATLLLPGIQIPGLPQLSFFHWIITIFVLVVVHEFSHGVIARLYDVEIKSSGFAIFGVLLPIIPAAFVEPDEKKLAKKSYRAQLSVFAAGSFANFITAGIFFLIFLFLMVPIFDNIYEEKGVIITGLQDDYPLKNAGATIGELITNVNDIEIKSSNDVIKTLGFVKPGDSVFIKTNRTEYNIIAAQNPEDSLRGYLGLSFSPLRAIKEEVRDKYGVASIKTFLWVHLLVFWIYFINFMIGLVNLLPIIITDGSKMLYLALLSLFKNEKRSKLFWVIINYTAIFLLLVNFLPNIIKLVT